MNDITNDISNDISNDITNELIEQMPEVEEEAIEQLQKEKLRTRSQLHDSLGRTFDPVLHKVDATGDPVLTKTGKLRILRGKAKKPLSSIGGVEETSTIFAAKGDLSDAAQIQATGQTCASLTFVIGLAIFGEDGKPTKEEIEQVTGAYQVYLTAKGYKDLPPGVVLITALSYYALPRIMKPKTQKKIAIFWGKAKDKWSKKRRPDIKIAAE